MFWCCRLWLVDVLLLGLLIVVLCGWWWVVRLMVGLGWLCLLMLNVLFCWVLLCCNCFGFESDDLFVFYLFVFGWCCCVVICCYGVGGDVV